MGEIAVVIPAYNASSTVEQVTREAMRHARRVVVVDDGSRDGTGGLAASTGAEVLTHPRNLGKGAALRTAFAALVEGATDAVITLDADGQHDPADIPRFVEAYRAGGADLIIGSRWTSFAGMSRGRRFGNRFSSRALAFFSGIRLPDSQSGFRLYSVPFLKRARLKGQAYELEMEAILAAAASGAKVETVPIRSPVADGRDRSHFRPVRDTYRICACVVGFALRRAVGRRR